MVTRRRLFYRERMPIGKANIGGIEAGRLVEAGNSPISWFDESDVDTREECGAVLSG